LEEEFKSKEKLFLGLHFLNINANSSSSYNPVYGSKKEKKASE